MWESRRDFQRVWEEWKAVLGFPFFPYSVISMACFSLGWIKRLLHSARDGHRHPPLGIECICDSPLIETTSQAIHLSKHRVLRLLEENELD
jgi:hypothetical protein